MKRKVTMLELAAAFNLLTAITNVVNTLLGKASTPAVDAMIADHLARQARIEYCITQLAAKVGITLPAFPAPQAKAQ